MRQRLIQQFIKKHPNHYLNPYLQNILDNDLYDDYDVIKDIITTSIKKELLTPSMVEQANILLLHLTEHSQPTKPIVESKENS
jgi:hypothetical protein